MKRESIQIGASEAAAALGLDAYKTPLMLYSEKVGLAEREPETDAQRLGKRIEHALADEFSEQHGVKLERWPTMFDTEEPWLRASLDRCIPFDSMTPAFREQWSVDEGEWLVWEAKTAGLVSARPVHEVQMRWGAPGGDDVPKGYALQVLIQCRVLNGHLQAMGAGFCRRGILKALVTGMGDPEYVINANPAVQHGLVSGLRDFVDFHLVPEVPPEPRTVDDWDTWMDERRQPMQSRTILFSNEVLDVLVRDFRIARMMRDKSVVTYAEAKSRLQDAIGENYGIDGTWGRVSYSKGSSGMRLREAGFATDVLEVCRQIAASDNDPRKPLANQILSFERDHSVPRVYGRKLTGTFRDENTTGAATPQETTDE